MINLCKYSDAYPVLKGTITVLRPNAAKKTKELHLKIMHRFSIAFQKLMALKLIMQKIWMLWCQCIIYLNTVKIIEKQHVVCGIVIEMNQVILFLLILNLLNNNPKYDASKVGKNISVIFGEV